MTLFNNGSISCKPEELDMVLQLFNASGIPPVSNYDTEDAYVDDNECSFEINEVYGDIEYKLKQFCKDCLDHGVKINFEINYSGDYEGTYLCKEGKFESLDAAEMHIRNASDTQLLEELRRRIIVQFPKGMEDRFLTPERIPTREEIEQMLAEDAKLWKDDGVDAGKIFVSTMINPSKTPDKA